MAYNRAFTLFLVALLLFAAANPSAHGAIIPFPVLNGLTVRGILCCALNGTCTGQGAAGVAGVQVALNCTILGVSTTVGLTTTNATGSFNITVPAIPGLVLGLLKPPCNASVQLPLPGVLCPVLSTTTGGLVGPLQSVGTLLTSALGLVQSARVSAFITL